MAVMNVMVGVRNSNKLKQTSSPSLIKKVLPIQRLTRQGRKLGNDNSIKIVHRTVEFVKGPIDYGNESQKLLFLTCLGLFPKQTSLTMPPYVKLERYDSPSKVIKNSNNYQTKNNSNIPVATSPPVLPNRNRKSDRLATTTTTTTHAVVKEDETYKLATRRKNNNTPVLYTDSDIEELDLELLICPYDIPHIFEEFFNKKSYRKPDTTRKNNRINKHTSSHHNNNINNKRNISSSYNNLRRQQPTRNNRSNIKNNQVNRQNAKNDNSNNNNKHNRNRSITQLIDIPFIDLTDDDEIYEDMNYEKSYLL